MHDCTCIYGYIKLENAIGLPNIKTNSSNTLTHTAAGILDSKRSCTGGIYHYLGVTYSQLTVVKTVTLTLKDFSSYVNLNSNEVHIGQDTQCPYNKGFCMDVV